ncbi:MAG: helix-turn-helix domain-containing protein, partial [Patescibacteria group bacterium]|nr:helix-turn-helix domain-containing protein [Patescibacteria group bacterium]
MKEKEKEISELITLKEACAILKCHPNTLRIWDKNGSLTAFRFGARKDRRYRREDILNIAAQKGNLSHRIQERIPQGKIENVEENVTLKEACGILKCHPNTLRQWDRKGILTAFRFGGKKERRYRKNDILTAARGIFLPKKVKKEVKNITLKEACGILKCHPNTLRQWDRKGILKAIRFGGKKERRYRQEDILRMASARENGLQPPIPRLSDISTQVKIEVNRQPQNIGDLPKFLPQVFQKEKVDNLQKQQINTQEISSNLEKAIVQAFRKATEKTISTLKTDSGQKPEPELHPYSDTLFSSLPSFLKPVFSVILIIFIILTNLFIFTDGVFAKKGGFKSIAVKTTQGLASGASQTIKAAQNLNQIAFQTTTERFKDAFKSREEQQPPSPRTLANPVFKPAPIKEPLSQKITKILKKQQSKFSLPLEQSQDPENNSNPPSQSEQTEQTPLALQDITQSISQTPQKMEESAQGLAFKLFESPEILIEGATNLSEKAKDKVFSLPAAAAERGESAWSDFVMVKDQIVKLPSTLQEARARFY